MSSKGINPIVSEYNILWEALTLYEEHLEALSSSEEDEDKQLEYDEKLQDVEGIKNSLKIAAKDDYELSLS